MNTNQSISHSRPLPHPPPQVYVSPLTRNSPRAYFQRSRIPVPTRVNSGTMNRNRFGLRKYAEQTLGSGSLRKCVTMPEGEDLDEWLAVHVVDFFTQINLLYGSITEFCSPVTCPEMKASNEFEYLWQDHKKYKNPTKMPAPEYIEHMMSWATEHINDEQLFPSRIGVKFPKNFQPMVRQIVKRLFRVYAHMYCHHYPVLVALGLDSHMNTSFKHYVLFVREFKLESGEGFYGPLTEMVEKILRSG